MASAARFRKGATKVVTLNQIAGAFKSDEPESSTWDKPAIGKNLFKDAADKIKLRMKVASILTSGVHSGQTDSRKGTSHDDKEFHAIFHAKQNEQEDPLMLGEMTVEENMWDIVTMDDEAIEEYASNELLGRFLSNTYFRTGILCVILVNSLLIAIETDQELERKYNHLFSVLDQCLMTIFVCEILVKWYHGFFMFWKFGWNVLDFFIVVALVLGPLVTTGSGSRGVLRILRVLRAFRSLRSISSLPGLQIVVKTILQSVPDMANIVLLLVIIMLVFSVIGITLFRDIVPKYFGSLSTAMFNLFVCLTQDGWMEIFDAFEEQGESYYVGGGLYLLVFIAIGAFVFANLVVAVVVTNLEFAMVDVKTQEKEREADDLKSKPEAERDDGTVPLLLLDDTAPRAFHGRMPFQIPEFKDISMEKLETYYLVLVAIEQNLAEYKKIKKEIVEIFGDVCDIQEKAKKEGILKDDSTASVQGSAEHMVQLTGGDLISNLMELESGRVFDSGKEGLTNILKEGAARVGLMKNRRTSAEGRRSSGLRRMSTAFANR